MLEQQFEALYLWFRANYYKRMVEKIGLREGSLNATEQYCVEIIYLLGTPTVGRFARFLNISVPNANYKLNSLVEKGYVVRRPSPRDQRESLLEVTDKFIDYYGLNDQGISQLIRRIHENFTPAEVAGLETAIGRILDIIRESADGSGLPEERTET